MAVLGLLLAGCASSPHSSGNHHRRFATGRPNYTVAPYQVNGVWYYPKVDYDYDATGTASWYGEAFDGRPTSDGEIFDLNQLTAAHKTLPLPSVVEVTNLRNGRELRLRVNDRGPFVGDRLIDVSRRAAQLLGFETAGMTPVRVRILKPESIQVAEAAMHGEFGPAAVGVAVAQSGGGRRIGLASAATRPAPVQQVQVAALAAPAPPPPAPAPVIQQPVIAAAAPAQLAPPGPAVPAETEALAAAPPPSEASPAPARATARAYWPSLIAPARAETLHAGAVPSAHGSRIFVQAGAFSVAENAQRVRARIAGIGSAEIIPATVNGTALYRVRVGPVMSEAEARRLLGRVVESGYPGARVVEE